MVWLCSSHYRSLNILPSRFRIEITNFRSKNGWEPLWHYVSRRKITNFRYYFFFFFFFPRGIGNSPMIYDSPLCNCVTYETNVARKTYKNYSLRENLKNGENNNGYLKINKFSRSFVHSLNFILLHIPYIQQLNLVNIVLGNACQVQLWAWFTYIRSVCV